MAHRPDQSRRRFIKGGLFSVPVVVTLAARPAWAQGPCATGYVPYAPEGEPGTSPAQPGGEEPGTSPAHPVFGPGVPQTSPTVCGEPLG